MNDFIQSKNSFHLLTSTLYSNFANKNMATIQQLTSKESEPAQVTELSLSSTSAFKIHHISGLKEFTNLKILVLSNNMISRLKNINCCGKLRVLMLDFNQIEVLEGTEGLQQLQQLNVSYNCIKYISGSIRGNRKLKILQLAYNQLPNIDSIAPLYETDIQKYGPDLLNLQVLSLYGNPIISTLNYLSFMKMFIPSLIYVDDKRVTEGIPTLGDVGVHEEVTILRDTVNKLIDERNTVISQLQEAKISPREPRKGSSQFIKQVEKKIKATDEKIKQMKQKIERLSELYTGNIQKNRHRRKMGLEPDNTQQAVSNKQILKQIKELEDRLHKYKNSYKYFCCLHKDATENEDSQLSTLLMYIIFGPNPPTHSVESLLLSFSKTIENGHSMMDLNNMMRKIIYGGEELSNDDQWLYMMMEKVEGRCGLLGVIEELREKEKKYKEQKQRFDEEKKKFISKFECQTRELSKRWDEFNVEKETFTRNIIRTEQQVQKKHEQHLQTLEKHYKTIEIQESNKIMNLQKKKGTLQQDVQKLTQDYENLCVQFDQKCSQLEQFEKCFEEFRKEEQRVKVMNEGLGEIRMQVQREQTMLREAKQRVKEMQLEENILTDQVSQIEKKCITKNEELKTIEKQFHQISKKISIMNDEMIGLNHTLTEKKHSLTNTLSEQTTVQKTIERSEKILLTLQQKIQNLHQLQLLKKHTINDLEANVSTLFKQKASLLEQNRKLQEDIAKEREEVVRWQMKVQEGRLAVDGLAEINKTIGEMMGREADLRRSILGLELEKKGIEEEIRRGKSMMGFGEGSQFI